MKCCVIASHRGLTLVELLVTMLIFSVVMVLTFSVFNSAQKTQTRLETKYRNVGDVDRIVRGIENLLRVAPKLIYGTHRELQFLNTNGDTVKYYLRNDTLFKNLDTLTAMPVDSLWFDYAKIIEGKEVRDFYQQDQNYDGSLDEKELASISGIALYIRFLTPDRSKVYPRSIFISPRSYQTF